MYKALVAVAVILAVCMITAGIQNQADAKKPKQVKCNNIKIQVKASGVEENQTYTANVMLGTGNKSKTVSAEDNISATFAFNFHKIQPCPAIGFGYSGDVNGTDFEGKINSLKKPNKVTVDLS